MQYAISIQNLAYIPQVIDMRGYFCGCPSEVGHVFNSRDRLSEY
ncbi:hypothetical protein AM1_A0218 (plasmid) [Acaryochloris marina MBIC11017]|uniref:Uncharacterized protein n=1 Tax=Acaryochloris marina (strain MBIC 11017) TaxID=329726 RepID=A8ZKM1_ACAM1|nr:hypothetical protein AM1_A0218 [Acaryochloris marina MBIC11017]